VVLYTDYKQSGRAAIERYELRICVQANNEEEAVENGVRSLLSNIPDDYRDFLDALGIFRVEAHQAATPIPEREVYVGGRYYRYKVGGTKGDARYSWT
jgi:hypothetical protein